MDELEYKEFLYDMYMEDYNDFLILCSERKIPPTDDNWELYQADMFDVAFPDFSKDDLPF